MPMLCAVGHYFPILLLVGDTFQLSKLHPVLDGVVHAFSSHSLSKSGREEPHNPGIQDQLRQTALGLGFVLQQGY